VTLELTRLTLGTLCATREVSLVLGLPHTKMRGVVVLVTMATLTYNSQPWYLVRALHWGAKLCDDTATCAIVSPNI